MKLMLARRPTHWLLTVLAALTLGLSGCGWHLAGTQGQSGANSERLHLSSVALIKQSGKRDLDLAVEKQLTNAGVSIQSHSESHLILQSVRVEKQPYAYSSTGEPVQFQLEMFVTYAIAKPAGEFLLAPKTIVSRRQYDFQVSAVIAKKQEENNLLREMYREVARKIVFDVRP